MAPFCFKLPITGMTIRQSARFKRHCFFIPDILHKFGGGFLSLFDFMTQDILHSFDAAIFRGEAGPSFQIFTFCPGFTLQFLDCETALCKHGTGPLFRRFHG